MARQPYPYSQIIREKYGLESYRSGSRIYYVGNWWWAIRTQRSWQVRCLAKSFSADDQREILEEYLKLCALKNEIAKRDAVWSGGKNSSKSPWKQRESQRSHGSALSPENSRLVYVTVKPPSGRPLPKRSRPRRRSPKE